MTVDQPSRIHRSVRARQRARSRQDRAYTRALKRAERRDRRHNRGLNADSDTQAANASTTFLAKPQTITPRGYAGENGGKWGLMPQLATWISSSVQVCGLYPFSVGSARPALGVPLGPDLVNWSLVYCDPISWFEAGLLSNPSVMMYGLPGLGKSTLVMRWLLGLADRGHPPLILGDIKGEYSALIRALGGKVTEIAPGKSTINPLDWSVLRSAADRIAEVAWVPNANHPAGGQPGAEIADLLRGLAFDLATTLVIALCRLVRGRGLQDVEETLISVGVRAVHDQVQHPQLLDLVQLLEHPNGHTDLMVATVSRTENEYRKSTRRLLQTLRSVLHGPMGTIFNGPTTVHIDLGNPGGMSVDLSKMRRADDKVLAAVMIATWAMGFSAIDAQWDLASAGLTEFHNPIVVGDELWKPMGLAPGMAKIVDQVFRTNRTDGVAQIMVTHSPKDAMKLPTRQDREIALGFAENAGMIVMFGMAKNALQALDETTVSLNEEERRQVASWRSPRSFRARRSRNGRPKPPPGAGKALIKVQDATGIAVQVSLVDAERLLHDTNERWNRKGA